MKRAVFWFVVLGLVILGLAVGPDLWAAPGQSPHRQTVPTRTPTPLPSTPSTEVPPAGETPAAPTATPVPPMATQPAPTRSSATPKTTAAVPAPTAIPSPSPTSPTPAATPSPWPVPPTMPPTFTPAPTTVVSPTPAIPSEPGGWSVPPLVWGGLGLIAVGLILLLALGRRRGQ